MLSEETRRKLREMNFGELVEAIDLQEKQPEYMALTFDERMNLAVDYTYSAKYNSKVHRLINAAKFRIADAALANVYYEKRGLDKDLILTLGNCGFIEKNQPVVFNGFTGSGKSYLACAIGRQACMQGFRTRYIRVPEIGLKYPNASTVSLLCFWPLKMTKTPKNSGFIVVASFLCNLSGRGRRT